MVDLWMPGAEQHSVGNRGAMEGGPARAVWHITSNSKDWTLKNELGWFTGGGAGVAPHLLWDPFTGQIAQFFPADSRALALQNAGSVRTNRTGKYCIQIEIVFTENETVGGKKYKSVAETPCKNLDKIVAWLRSLGIKDAWPGGAPTGFVRDTVSIDTWLNKGGHYGHNQIPGNSHVDPGPMPDLFKGATPKPAPKPKPVYAPFPGAAFFRLGRKSSIVTAMGKRLVAEGYKGYKEGPGPTFTQADKKAYAWWQKKLGYSGADADGVPGKTSWDKLRVPKS